MEKEKVERKVRRSRSLYSRFKRENDLDAIKNYLNKQKANNQPIVFYYRQDRAPRRIYNYYLDERYINAKGNKGYYIKYLIDRIRKI